MKLLTYSDLKLFEQKRCLDIKDVLSYLETKCSNSSLDDKFFCSMSIKIYSEYALEFYCN